MNITIRNIVIATPDPPALAQFYADLLGWQIIRRDWFVVAPDRDSFLRLAFGDGPGEYRPPRWPDPEYPQQLHLDFLARDLDAAEDLALRLGARALQERDEYRSYADPAGHPFCIYRLAEWGSATDESRPAPINGIWRIVYDCFSPRALAGFYGSLLTMPVRIQDTEQYVVIAREDRSPPVLAFQHAVVAAPRWPDPAYPQQLHLDLDVEDGQTASDLALRLGAICLPARGGSCPVFADPAAHPFCICSPGQ